MMILVYIVVVAWGSLSGLFLVQIVSCFIGMCQHVVGFFFSKVHKRVNGSGFLATLGMVIGFGVLFFGGNLVASHFIDYGSMRNASILSLIAGLATIVYFSRKIPGKIVLTNECVWSPSFFEASSAMPENQRVAFARKHRKENAKAGSARRSS
jgi:hypothetical protein